MAAEIEINGKLKKFLIFDEEAFDYEMDEKELIKAIQFCGDSPESKKVLNGEIQSHFMSCISEFLGFEITIEELLESIESGKLERKVI